MYNPSNLASIDNFNIDVEKDLLKSVAEISEQDNVGGLLSGTDSLSLSTENKYDDMSEILRSCYELYKSEQYKDNFEWVDQIQAIKDKELIGEYKIKNHVIGSNNTLSTLDEIPLKDIKENGNYILRLVIQYTDEKGRLKSLIKESQFTIDNLSETHI